MGVFKRQRDRERMYVYLEPLTLFSSCFASLSLKFKENIWRGSSQECTQQLVAGEGIHSA